MRYLLALPLLFAFACSHGSQQTRSASEEQQQTMQEGTAHEGCACGDEEKHEGCNCEEGACDCESCKHEHSGSEGTDSEQGSDGGMDDEGSETGE